MILSDAEILKVLRILIGTASKTSLLEGRRRKRSDGLLTEKPGFVYAFFDL
jgi:hypothetical protein